MQRKLNHDDLLSSISYSSQHDNFNNSISTMNNVYTSIINIDTMSLVKQLTYSDLELLSLSQPGDIIRFDDTSKKFPITIIVEEFSHADGGCTNCCLYDIGCEIPISNTVTNGNNFKEIHYCNINDTRNRFLIK